MTDFERRARLAAPYFQQQLRYDKTIIPPPFTVEFFGPASSGKTTTIREADKFFKRQTYRTFHPQEGAEAVRHLNRKTPFYNIATGIYAYNILMQVSEGHLYDFVFFDRCLFDAYTWMKYWNKKGKLEEPTMRQMQEFFLYGVPRIDIAFVMTCDPAVAIQRETKNELTDQLGTMTNPETLRLLSQCNLEAYDELKGRFGQLVHVDTTGMTELAMVQHVTGCILGKLEQKILEASRDA